MRTTIIRFQMSTYVQMYAEWFFSSSPSLLLLLLLGVHFVRRLSLSPSFLVLSLGHLNYEK